MEEPRILNKRSIIPIIKGILNLDDVFFSPYNFKEHILITNKINMNVEFIKVQLDEVCDVIDNEKIDNNFIRKNWNKILDECKVRICSKNFVVFSCFEDESEIITIREFVNKYLNNWIEENEKNKRNGGNIFMGYWIWKY